MISLPLVFGAFLAGLAGSPHCVVMCGAFASACARPARGLGAWHAGRLIGYGILGALAGAFGGSIPGPAWLPPMLAVALLCWFAAALAGLLPEPRPRLPGFASAGRLLRENRGMGARFAFGIVNGFVPCGLVYSALSVPVALAHPVAGAVAMVAFGAGTLPSLSIAALTLHRFAPRTLAGRRILALAVLFAGLWSIGIRTGTLAGTHSHEHSTGSEGQNLPGR
jgi:sulfite exporter TauE/SafE